MLRLASWGWGARCRGVFFGIADRLIVGAMLGPKALALYAVAVQLTQQRHAISAAGASVLLPRLSLRSAEETSDSGARAAWTVFLWMACAIVLTAVLLATFGREVLNVWLRMSVSLETVQLFRQLTLASAILAMNVVPHFALLARSRVRRVAVSNIGAGAISCALMLWLTPVVGIDAIGYAKIAFGLITTATS